MKIKILFGVAVLLAGCRYDKFNPYDGSGYPEAVGKIMVSKCATAGCHNTQSASNAAGLDYSTWEKMFGGGKNGSSVIPFSTEYSYLMYFVNTYDELGIHLAPSMPYNQPALSKEEVITLRDWIAAGAPSKEGEIKFSDNPSRKKMYVCNQGCDAVAVFDAESKVIMRYVKVGVDAAIEAPHQIRISPDGKYWCVAFISGHVVQVFNTNDDHLVASIEVGIASWNTIVFTPDSKKLFVCATLSNPQIAEIDLTTMTKVGVNTDIEYPHGSYITHDGNTMYVTSQNGNHITKLHFSDGSTEPVMLDGSPIPNTTPGIIDPHEIIFTPDETKYFVTCQKSNDVRVFKTSNDSLLAVLPVGIFPQEMSLSQTHHRIYVTCMEDSTSFGVAHKGSVFIIDYLNNSIVSHLYPGFQPHGIAADDDHQLVYVLNLNYDTNGPAPHHVSSCGGRNGYLSIIDMSNNQLLQQSFADGTTYQYKNELLSFPYFVAYRK